MPNTTDYDFGDIVLVPFPFTDQSGAKKRPAVVVSSDAYHKARSDLVIMAITGRVTSPGRFGDVEVQRWREAGLLKRSVVKPIMTTVEKKLVLRRLGRLTAEDAEILRENLRSLLG
ncbi:MAG TPA: type II toxin-antitoxin system PemK/MazF family toxin [Dongiaceae bacterium]|nr:type II toxin-antitoxin system PemK/MazF family toxin [Dongiaceae bacterium]